MDQIYATLFDRIIKNYYPPNSRLREDTLSKEFNVSRTPIRTVLRQLEQDDLSEIMPKRGAKVHSFTADDLEDIYESCENTAKEHLLPIEALCIRDLGLSKNRLSDHIQNSKIRILHKVIQGKIP